MFYIHTYTHTALAIFTTSVHVCTHINFLTYIHTMHSYLHVLHTPTYMHPHKSHTYIIYTNKVNVNSASNFTYAQHISYLTDLTLTKYKIQKINNKNELTYISLRLPSFGRPPPLHTHAAFSNLQTARVAFSYTLNLYINTYSAIDTDIHIVSLKIVSPTYIHTYIMQKKLKKIKKNLKKKTYVRKIHTVNSSSHNLRVTPSASLRSKSSRFNLMTWRRV